MPSRPPVVRTDWPDLPEQDLLDVRICDLGLTIEGSWLAPRVQQLQD
jgi:hypothetical protein